MTNLSKDQKVTVEGLKARKAMYDQKLDKINAEAERLRADLQVNLAQGVLEALGNGVPQSRISIEAFGYNQANGIRSLFGLPMRGSIEDYLKNFVKTRGDFLASSEFNLDEAETKPAALESVFFMGDAVEGGYRRWHLERPDGTRFNFVDGRGYLVWSAWPRDTILTEQEIALMEAELPNNEKREWDFDPRITKQEFKARQKALEAEE